ncbi:MAG: Sapep family Mn(2+)-dependent dipeptidase [Mollicutes bacterium PWAP]|nr:Sapep family Mn(2+)-dependent dipeptidase [Mollicutes bacterium PWAP]
MNKEEIIKKVSSLVKIDTTFYEEKITKEYPFGEGVKKSFDLIEKWAKKDGFIFNNFKNEVATVSLGKINNKNYIGIANHIDTVPFDSRSWSFDPLSGEFKDGYIYGRGTQDDKSPTIAVYLALKFIKENKIKLNREIRLIIGGNEERNHLGLTHYFEKFPYPIASFTADNTFPLVNGEKGGAIFEATINKKHPLIIKFFGGEVVNAVAEYAEAIVKKEKGMIGFFNSHKNDLINLEIIDNGNTLTIKGQGKPSHGSMPENGISASTNVLKMINDFSYDNSTQKILNLFHDKFYGEGFGLEVSKEEGLIKGKPSSSCGIIKTEKGNYQIHVDLRFPSIFTKEFIEKKLIKYFDNIKPNKISNPLFISEEKKLTKILINSYRDITGDKNAKPELSGGGTYAKVIPNCLAFGMLFPGEEERMHNIDERIAIESILKAIQIYVEAIIKLANADW